MENIRNSFPEKSDEEIRKIAKGFYYHLCDVLLESMKAFTMKEEKMVKRYLFKNTEFLNELYRQGKSVIGVAGHFNNWEWGGLASGTQIKHKPVGFYKPLSNKYIDDYVKKTRVKGRSVLVSITDTIEVFKKQWDEPCFFYMVADQSPSSIRLAYWVKFLNRDTATLHGPEKYARFYKLPVVYVDIQKVKRGYYDVEFIMLCEDPSVVTPTEITQKFMNFLEQKIREKPQYYLWSHRRWKRQRTS